MSRLFLHLHHYVLRAYLFHLRGSHPLAWAVLLLMWFNIPWDSRWSLFSLYFTIENLTCMNFHCDIIITLIISKHLGFNLILILTLFLLSSLHIVISPILWCKALRLYLQLNMCPMHISVHTENIVSLVRQSQIGLHLQILLLVPWIYHSFALKLEKLWLAVSIVINMKFFIFISGGFPHLIK